MSLFRALTSTAVAASLLAAPVVAQAAQSAVPARTATEVEGESLRGGFIIPLIAVIAIILGILALTSDGEDRPSSP